MNDIILRPYQQSDYRLLDYALDDEQAEFTTDIGYCINERLDLQDTHKTVVTIVQTATHTPIGFFVLDIGADKYRLTDNNQAVLIRSFSINPQFQGKGYGKQSMQLVADFLQSHLANVDINEIVLSVNFRNIGAYRTYLKAGFIDTGRVIVGPAGEQHVLSQPL